MHRLAIVQQTEKHNHMVSPHIITHARGEITKAQATVYNAAMKRGRGSGNKRFLFQTLGVSVKLHHVFARERDDAKQRFSQSQFRTQHVFADVSELTRRCARDIITGTDVYIPWSFVFMAGLSCKRRTLLSSQSSANINCRQREARSIETGHAWTYVFRYIKK